MNTVIFPNMKSLLPGLGRRVLLVDDNLVQLKLVRMQLEEAGFVVETANGASAAEEVLRSKGVPAAIVSDVVMDGVDGFNLCKKLRRDPNLYDVPIVLLSSAFDEEEDRVLARSLGASALVSRSATQQACVEALVRSLADSSPPAGPSKLPELYVDRIVHQVARLSDRTTSLEARFERLFEEANDAISVTTPEGVVLDVNRKWRDILGVSRADARGRHVTEFIALADDDGDDELHAMLALVGRRRTLPVPVRHRNGTTIHLEFSTATIDCDGVTAVLSIGRDVTDLVETTRRLEASERHYRRLVENVPDVFWSATASWDFTFCSPNVERVTGFTASQMVRSTLEWHDDRVHPDDVERVQAARRALAGAGTPVDITCRWLHREGRWIWLHLRATRTATGYDGIYTDITARKELEDQLIQSQKIEAIGQLTAGVAHDFNNILAVVRLNAELLVASLPKGDVSWEIAREVSDAGLRGIEMTKQLLEFSRRQPFAPRSLDLNTLLVGMKRLLARTVGPGVKLTTDECAQLGRVSADGGQLEQVVMNLVVNARDAMNARGNLHIATSNVDTTDDTWPEGLLPGSYVKLSVTDDGCGMDAETQKRVFEPFFTTKPVGKGTGLGLATCYGIVRHARGHISIVSELGKGAAFHVYLPRTE